MSADERKELVELREENAKLRKEARDLTWTVLALTKKSANEQPAKPERFDPTKGGRR